MSAPLDPKAVHDIAMMTRRMILIVTALAGLIAGVAIALSLKFGPPSFSLVLGFAIAVAALSVVLAFLLVRAKKFQVIRPGQAGFRDTIEQGYQKFLTWGPLSIGLFGAVSTHSLWRLRHGAELVDGIAHVAAIAGFLAFWVLYTQLLFGGARPKDVVAASEDELTRDLRARGIAAGYVTAAVSALVFLGLSMVWPRHVYLAAPALLSLPLMVAMWRFGVLQRRAAMEEDQ